MIFMPRKQDYKKKGNSASSGGYSFKRVPEEESENVVYWFEDAKGNVMSFVKEPSTGDYFLRITYNGKRMNVAFPLSGGFPSGVPPAEKMLATGLMHLKRGY
jgi:hypothetical protein